MNVSADQIEKLMAERRAAGRAEVEKNEPPEPEQPPTPSTPLSRQNGTVDKIAAKGPQYDKEGAEGMQLKYNMVTIKDLVPEDHFLRKLEQSLD